jgi:hypothetical protein
MHGLDDGGATRSKRGEDLQISLKRTRQRPAGLIRINGTATDFPRLATKESPMTGITLTAEQIRNAPAPVRQWIEQQVMASLGLAAQASAPAPPHAAHLVACSAQIAAAVLAQVQNIPPAANVLFEFGRPGICFGEPAVMSFRLVDIQHHASLGNVGEVMQCLETINKAFVQVSGDPSARFCGFDNEGHCFIAPGTQKGIAALLSEMIANHRQARLAGA